MSFAKRFRETREGAGLTIAALVRAMAAFTPGSKIAHTVIHAWEGGVTQSPSADYLIKAARVLNVTPEWLLWGEDDPFQACEGGTSKAKNTIPYLEQQMLFNLSLVNWDSPNLRRMEHSFTKMENTRHAQIFALIVSNDSLMPMASLGDLLIIDKTLIPKPGDTILSISHQYQQIIMGKYKPVHFASNLAEFDIEPYNSNWPTHRFTKGDSDEIAGVLIEVRHPTVDFTTRY